MNKKVEFFSSMAVAFIVMILVFQVRENLLHMEEPIRLM